MKETDYINLLESSMKIFSSVRVFPKGFIYGLNEIRKCNQKYSKEISYYFLYPRYELTKANLWMIEIKTICRRIEVNHQFSYLDEVTRKNGVYVKYFFNSIEITDLINV